MEDNNNVVRDGDLEQNLDYSSNKKRNKVVIIGLITGICLTVIAIIVVIIMIISSSNKEKGNGVQRRVVDNRNVYLKCIDKALKSGSLAKEVKKALALNDIESEEVELLDIDIDSDGTQELVAFVETPSNNLLLQFDVDEDVLYERSFFIGEVDDLGLGYSIKDEGLSWYTKYDKTYTVIGHTKLVIKEEDFTSDYYYLTKMYKNNPILMNTVNYKLGNKLDLETLEENRITNKDVLDDLDITLESVKDKVNNYIKEKEEEEKKKKEEEEKKKKEEEEAQAKEAENSFYLNGLLLHYGNYLQDGGSISELTINKDGSGFVNDEACTWVIGTSDFTKDEDVYRAIPAIVFYCGKDYYYLTAFNKNILSDGGDINLSFNE